MAERAPSYTVAELAERVGGELRGPDDVRVTGINALRDAQPQQITFIADDAHAAQWGESAAGAVLVSRNVALDDHATAGRPVIVVDDAELATIPALELFAPPPVLPEVGVHPSALVDESATVSRSARIGPHVSIGAHATIGEGVVLHAGVRVYDHVSIGDGAIIHGNCVIRERCTIGRAVILHPGVVIGSDGFGYRPAPDGRGLVKVPQIGTVTVEDGVEMGAGCAVDRGKFGATVIGAGSKLDNLVHIAHNCRIGRSCMILALTSLGGSVEVGDGAIIGGHVAVRDHIRIGRGARVGSKSGVVADVGPGETVLGLPASAGKETLRQWAAIRKLPDLMKRLSGGRLTSRSADDPHKEAAETAERH